MLPVALRFGSAGGLGPGLRLRFGAGYWRFRLGQCASGNGVAATASIGVLRTSAGTTGAPAARPPRSQFLQRRHDVPAAGQKPSESPGEPVRYGPLDVDLQPRDQLRPLLPTWNPPPTRQPRPEELELSTRLRLKFEDRWWAATVREVGDDGQKVKVGYDGWPSRHDEWLPRQSDRLYLHESVHPDYVAPPLPQRYQRPVPTDEEGKPLPVPARQPRPKVFDPEKERMKRALRPPLPYNPEKERLKRQLRGQYAPPIEETQPTTDPAQEEQHVGAAASSWSSDVAVSGVAAADVGHRAPTATTPEPVPPPAPTPAAAAATPADLVEWVEIPGGSGGTRAFRHMASGEIRQGAPPSGWVELLADGGSRYYWHVGRNITQWERPH
mmetsp:Transcript_77037/g.214262  ORF Transcript_77037/g.214262 Transcript_77037/m.214262 type:complete len:383 (-) Transcript_77037:107-1255(-)